MSSTSTQPFMNYFNKHKLIVPDNVCYKILFSHKSNYLTHDLLILFFNKGGRLNFNDIHKCLGLNRHYITVMSILNLQYNDVLTKYENLVGKTVINSNINDEGEEITDNSKHEIIKEEEIKLTKPVLKIKRHEIKLNKCGKLTPKMLYTINKNLPNNEITTNELKELLLEEINKNKWYDDTKNYILFPDKIMKKLKFKPGYLISIRDFDNLVGYFI